MAALIVLATIGAVLSGVVVHENEEAVQSAAARASHAPAKAHDVPAEGEKRSPAPHVAAKPEIRALPKWPADHPFELIRELASAAYEGNGDAQLRIAKELGRCNMTLSLVRKSVDPDEAIWNLPEGWTQTMKERAFAEYHRCERLRHEDPFAGLPPRVGGYKDDYWLERAVESGQPVAIMQRGINRILVETGDSDESGKRRAEAREMMLNATLSGNPDAQLLMGFMMRASGDAERQLQAAAWMLAACRAGADCGSDSAIIPLWMCYDAECQPGLDVETMVRTSFGPEDLAQIQARDERISAALRSRDAEAIRAEIGLQAP